MPEGTLYCETVMCCKREWGELPRRLRPVAELLLRGMRNREIAGELSLSEHTIENYVSDILAHYGCRDRVDFVIRCSGED